MKEMNASDFKAKCLAILDEVARTGESVLILKRGKPVAKLIPTKPDGGYPIDSLIGTVHVIGDIISPAVDPSEWEALRDSE